MAGLLFPILLLVVMYFFLIVPQRKKAKAQTDLLGTLGPGDEVVTSGGIYGGIVEVDGDALYLEIAPDVEIKVARRAIADRTYRATTPKAAGAKSGGSKAVGAAAPEVPEPYEPDDDETETKNTK